MSWSPTYQDEAIMIAKLDNPTDSQKVRLIKLRVLKSGHYINPWDNNPELRNQMFEVAKKEFLR